MTAEDVVDAVSRPVRERSPLRLSKGAGPFVFTGAGAVVGGGLVAAAIGEAPSAHGTWAVAYLVLVVGVAQVLLGLGQVAVGATPRRARSIAQLWGWQVGSGCVLGGVLERTTTAVDVGSAILLVTLGLFAVPALRPARDVARTWRWGYRALLGILVLSVVSGALLARSASG